MTTTRLATVGAVGLGTAVALAILAPGGNVPPIAVPAWRSLPDDAIAVAHLDVRALSGSTLYRSLGAAAADELARSSPVLQEFIEATGFDAGRDLDTLTLGAGRSSLAGDGGLYLIATGRFDRGRMREWFERRGATESDNRHGFETWTLHADEPPVTLAVLGFGTLVAAPASDFDRLVVALRREAPGAERAAVGRLLERARGQMVFALSMPDATSVAENAPSDRTRSAGVAQLQALRSGPLGELRSMVLTVDAASGLDLDVQAVADTADAGRQIHEMLGGYLAMARAMAGQDPAMRGALRRLVLEQDGAILRVGWRLEEHDLRAVLESSGSALAAGG